MMLGWSWLRAACATGAAAAAVTLSTSAAFAQTAATTPVSTTATAGGVCVDDDAKQSLTACPNSGPQTFDVGAHGKAPTVAFHSAIDTTKTNKVGTPSFDQSEARDDRANRLAKRGRALLVTEIQKLELLFSSTPANAPDRADLARRLAEDYVELEGAAFRDKTQAEIARDGLKKTNPGAAAQQQATADQSAKIMAGARGKAESYYTMIKNDYPAYPKIDEILYYLAYEYEQGNDFTNARKVYYELIQKAPSSKYIPNAYLAFGELFFNEAQGDPSKWGLAAQAYGEVIKYPPPKNTVYGYAWYKIAYVFWNNGELDKSLNAFKKTIDYGTQWPQQPGAVKLADSARRDLIPVYALRGDPTAAYNFFHNLSGDPPGANVKTYKMMDDLGQNYLDTGHYPEAISLYKDLIRRDSNGPHTCAYQSHIAEATLALKSGQKDQIRAVLEDQLKQFQSFKNSSQPADAKTECANKTAALVTETALAWHLEAVGAPNQRGTNDPKTMKLAAELYQRVVDTWSAQEFGTFEFPKIVKEDWPTIYKIKYEMADLLYFQQDWAKCGPAFDAVVAENPTGPDAAESAYASVLCYQNIYEAQHKDGSDKKGSGNLPGQTANKSSDDDRLKPKQLTDNQKGMLTAFNRYICYIHPAANDSAGQNQLVEVKYARARTYFEAQHWAEASVAFRDIAINNADKDVGIYAAQLYLECVNVLGSHSAPPRPSCFDDMGADVPKFIDLYCSGDKLAKNQEQCTSLAKIQCDIQRLKAQKLVELADKSGGGQVSAATYEQAGNTYFELWRKYGETPIAAGQPAQCDKLDEIVYNAAKAFQAARLLARSINALRTLLEPKYHMDTSPLAKKAVYQIGGLYQAIAVYDQASDWYEKYAQLDSKADKADTALSDATQLRLGLGQEDQAIKDAQLFTKSYGSSKPAQTAAIAFAVGAHYAEKEDWEKTRGALSGYMSVIDKAAPDIQVQAHSALGRAYTHLHGKESSAKGEYARTRSLWSNPDDAVAKIRASYPDEDESQKVRRIGKALNAVGEAYFYAAEEDRKAKVEPLKFPEYHGNGTKDDVMKHIKGKVVVWYQKKSAAIKEVEPGYIKILDLKPDAPPKWVIAAGSRDGLMWGDFVDDFRKAPIPDSMKKDSEIRGAYYDGLDAASQPFKDNNAKPALKKCLDLSVKFQYFDEFSRNCEVWLAKNYKAEYHVVDELRGTPTLANSGLDDKPPPLLVGGLSWHPASAAPPQSVASQTANGTGSGTSTTAAPFDEPQAAPRRSLMKSMKAMAAATSLLGFLVGCGGGGEPAKGPTTTATGPATPVAVTESAQNKFNAAIDAFAANDKNAAWNDASCAQVAQMFEGAASENGSNKFPEATYDAGLAYQRCGNDAQARAHFEKALSDEPKFHQAKAQLALYDYKKTGNEDQAITSLQQAVLDAQFQNVPALVDLAMFQMQRDSATGSQGCANDLECAKQNLQRALAIDDGYMPAFNQLALYYFQLAKKRAAAGGSTGSGKGHRGGVATNAAMGKHGDTQQLELAALVCSQALRKNASYAPIHNTAGLIQNELGQVNGAVAEFKNATQLDPSFFEAQMNYAEVNLSFRGFDQAQGAFKKAVEMRPNDYDAHLGLALALRGQITDSNYDQQVTAVQAELDSAKKIDGNRPDAYYNEGILTQEYKAKSGGDKAGQIAKLEQAKAIFQSFIDKASGKAEYAGAVTKAQDRMKDIDDTIAFLKL